MPLVLANEQSQKLTDPPQKGVFRITFSANDYGQNFIPY